MTKLLRSFVFLLVVFTFHSEAHSSPRPVVVFDLDHTLINTNPRILAILHEIGLEQNLPQLLSLTLQDIELLRLGRVSLHLESVFGSRANGSLRQSEFGRRFYFESSYLKFDSVMPGGPQFVTNLMQALDVDVVYLTGRLDEYFRSVTEEQLAYYAYPGFGAAAALSSRVSLILKSRDDERDNEVFKDSVLQELEQSGRLVVAVFDDSKRNINHLRETLHPSTVLTRLTADVSDQVGLLAGIEQISNFTANISRVRDLRRMTSNAPQLALIQSRIDLAICTRLLK